MQVKRESIGNKCILAGILWPNTRELIQPLMYLRSEKCGYWLTLRNMKLCLIERCLSFSFQRFVAKVSDQVTPSVMTVTP